MSDAPATATGWRGVLMQRRGRGASVPGAPVLTDAERRARTVITPEGVRLSITLASRGARAAALMIDLFLIGFTMTATTLLLVWMAGGIGISERDLQANTARAGALQALVVIWFIAMFLYRNAWFLSFELGPRGATPGKRLMGIRVAARGAMGADASGGRLTTEAVIARNLMRDIELYMPLVFIGGAIEAGSDTELAGWSGAVWFAVFVLFPFLNRDGLRCGDVIAGTWVVEAPRRKLEQALSLGAAARGASAASGAQYHFGEAELAVYGEYELQVLERVLRDNQPEAMREVAETICAKIGWTGGKGDERAFLEAYYTQLRARLEQGMRFDRRKANKHTPGGG
ncbi:RDD family protein [Novosphingobium sp. Chol11]|uniref:RDD family protein n=1 Tax=Novosphingobium sp. Chol11 TaxID=1385763 RepID=UPI0025D1C309|nr:RDD family protein [Novosphingobium sp. Chol11]